MVRSRVAVRRKPRSRLSWATLTMVPWCLAGGLLVSMAADAGQDPVTGTTRVGLTDAASPMPVDLVPPAPAREGTDLALPRDSGPEARPAAPDAAETPPAEPDAIEPRALPKEGEARPAPVVERRGLGEPAVAVRPTFEARLRAPGSLRRVRAASLVFGDPGAAPENFVPGPVQGPWADPSQLQPRPRDLRATPTAAQDGVAPPVPPVSPLPAPAEVAALPKFSRGPHGLVTDNQTVGGAAPPHPDYRALIETAKSAPEQRCLAQAVYFEARSEPEEGQAAVAQVVLNRAMSGLYPGSVCGVVFQNQQHRRACQFSFACEGRALHVTEDESWNRAVRVAREVTEGSTYVSDIGASTHYHADAVRPGWARTLIRTEAIGHHIFYAMKPRQS